MNIPTKLLCGICVLLLLLTACGKRPPKVRDESFLACEQPVKVSDLVHAGLAQTSQGGLRMTAFIHSAFPSATETHDAIAAFESKGGEHTTWSQVLVTPTPYAGMPLTPLYQTPALAQSMMRSA